MNETLSGKVLEEASAEIVTVSRATVSVLTMLKMVVPDGTLGISAAATVMKLKARMAIR